VYNPATDQWGYYGFANEGSLNAIKSFDKDMTFNEFIKRIGEPWAICYNINGDMILEYVTQEGFIKISFKDGCFDECRIVNTMGYL
jgi:hypothetical protein